MYNCLVGAGGICRFIKINKNKKNNFIDVNFIHSLKAPFVTRRLPDRYNKYACFTNLIYLKIIQLHIWL